MILGGIIVWNLSKMLNRHRYFMIIGFILISTGVICNAVALQHNNNMMPVLKTEGYDFAEDYTHFSYSRLEEVNLPILTDFIPNKLFILSSIGDLFIIGGKIHILGCSLLILFDMMKLSTLSKIYKPRMLDKNYKELIYK